MKEELKRRTKNFAIENFRLCQTLSIELVDFKRQLIRCSSSVGANYRAACRAKSTKDFTNKLKIVEEELDESLFFNEIIRELSPNISHKWNEIHKEDDQLLSILVKSITTLKRKQSATTA